MNNENTLHPGQILNDQFLIPKQISINTFATQTGITENHMSVTKMTGEYNLLIIFLNQDYTEEDE